MVRQMVVGGLLVWACGAGVPQAVAEEGAVTVALVGDSTVTDQAGWGKAFAGHFDGKVKVLNFAVGGRSSRSWHDEGRLPAVLKAKPGFVLIQFGHNDQPGKGIERETEPAGSFRDFLRLYVNAFRAAGAKPVLVSSVARRVFDEEGRIVSNLAPWAEAAGAVAEEMGVPFIDLHALSVAYHNRIGREASMAFNPKEGDMTHFNAKGAAVIAELIVGQIKTAVPELGAHVTARSDAAP